jgi:hypothetical protein
MPYTAQPASDCKTFRTLCEPPSADVGTELSSNIRMDSAVFVAPDPARTLSLANRKRPRQTPPGARGRPALPIYIFANICSITVTSVEEVAKIRDGTAAPDVTS